MSGHAAVVISIIAVAMLAAGCIDPGDPSPVRVFLSTPHMETRTSNNTTVWDCTFNVTRLNPSTSRVSWSELKVAVKSAQGGVLIPFVTTSQYPGPDLWSPTVYRIEQVGSRLTMDVGDAVMLGAINGTYIEGEIDMVVGGNLLTLARLPPVFP